MYPAFFLGMVRARLLANIHNVQDMVYLTIIMLSSLLDVLKYFFQLVFLDLTVQIVIRKFSNDKELRKSRP